MLTEVPVGDLEEIKVCDEPTTITLHLIWFMYMPPSYYPQAWSSGQTFKVALPLLLGVL